MKENATTLEKEQAIWWGTGWRGRGGKRLRLQKTDQSFGREMK